MLKTNSDSLVEITLQCKPGMPKKQVTTLSVGYDGKPFMLPGIGGIVTNVSVGDSAFGWAGDHIEPDVSCIYDTKKPFEHPNTALQFFSCVGNRAEIIDDDKKYRGSDTKIQMDDKVGTVIGHHGGSEHVIVWFKERVKRSMTYDDKIIIHSIGQGLKLLDYPNINVCNIDPTLFGMLKIKEWKGRLKVPVTTIIPAECMGSGVGSIFVGTGDYDIMTSDDKTVTLYGIDKIRFGDFVAIMDHENTYGRTYIKGAMTIGVVVHSDCLLAGHGPGVTTIMSSRESTIVPVIEPCANIADILKIGNYL